jgi:hypothetical protein
VYSLRVQQNGANRLQQAHMEPGCMRICDVCNHDACARLEDLLLEPMVHVGRALASFAQVLPKPDLHGFSELPLLSLRFNYAVQCLDRYV